MPGPGGARPVIRSLRSASRERDRHGQPAAARVLRHRVPVITSMLMVSGMPVLGISGTLTSGGVDVAMTKTPVEIDDDALAAAAQVLGTKTKKDTVNAALREVSQRLLRLRALEKLGEMADRGDFDEFLDGKAAYRR